METNKCHYFNEAVYDQMHLPEDAFPTIEFGQNVEDGGGGAHPFGISHKLQYLHHIYSRDQLEALQQRLGRSIYFTHLFTELTKSQ